MTTHQIPTSLTGAIPVRITVQSGMVPDGSVLAGFQGAGTVSKTVSHYPV